MAIVPKKIELPKIPMQIFAADIVIDANQTATDEGVAAFGSVHMNVGPRIFKRPMADRFVRPGPALLEPAIRRRLRLPLAESVSDGQRRASVVRFPCFLE